MSRPLERQVIFSTPYFELVAKSWEGLRGDPYYSIEAADYVCIIAVTRGRQIVLVREFRPAVEAEVIELPSGHVEGDESPVEAAARELYEETGFKAPQAELLGSLKPDTGRLSNRLHVCFAADVEAPEEVHKREPGVEPIVCSLDEFQRLFAEGAFDHALQIAAICLAVSLGRLPSLRIDSFRGGEGDSA